jgi:enamine deaminase RidA (YjgF/YER057c/UK114 family)
MIERQQIFPEGMPKRIVNGHLLYTPVVTVVPGKLVFVSGILARNSRGEIVGKGDMAAQIGQVYENIRTALAAAGATMADIVKRQTFHDGYRRLLRQHRRPHGARRRSQFDQHDGRGPQAFASRLSDRSRGDGGDTGALRTGRVPKNSPSSFRGARQREPGNR